AWQLQEAMPGRRVELEILAEGGANLARMDRKLAGLEHCPDAMIIYVGHNEFIGRYDPGRAAPMPSAPARLGWDWPDRAGPYSPFCRMVQRLLAENRVDEPPPAALPRRLVDWPACTPSEYAEVVADFRRRLEATVAFCERLGTLPILIIPPGNDG